MWKENEENLSLALTHTYRQTRAHIQKARHKQIHSWHKKWHLWHMYSYLRHKGNKAREIFLQTTVSYASCLERTVFIAETKESPPTDSLTRLKQDRNNFEYTLLSHFQTFHPLEDRENNSYWTLCNLTQQRWECFCLSITCIYKFVRVTYEAPTPSAHFPTLPTNSTDMRKLQLWGSAEVRGVLTHSIFPSGLQDQRQLWTQKVSNDT